MGGQLVLLTLTRLFGPFILFVGWQVSTNFCSDGDLIHDFSAEWANRTNSSSSLTEELENALQADTSADQRLNLSDMETQFPGVRFI